MGHDACILVRAGRERVRKKSIDVREKNKWLQVFSYLLIDSFAYLLSSLGGEEC